MKRIVCGILSLIILFSFPVCAFADGIDWYSMTDEQIEAEIIRARQELTKRRAVDRGALYVANDKYAVQVLDIKAYQSSDGKYNALIECEFTNNTESPTNMDDMVSFGAYQADIQCYHLMEYPNGYDMNLKSINVKNGASIIAYDIIPLNNITDDLEFTVYLKEGFASSSYTKSTYIIKMNINS